MSAKEIPSHQQIQITPPINHDVEKLKPILEQHIRNIFTKEVFVEEIDEILECMKGELDKEGRSVKFLVARDIEGTPVGCMAYSEPDHDMRVHFSTNADESMELLNAFVSQEHYRGKGVGRKLFEGICHMARSLGKKQLIVNSGPRYMRSWGFYDKVTDGDKGSIKDKYGEGYDAKTWIKKL